MVPANQDICLSDALRITREIDPRGERSMVCLTKIDIMDRGTDARIILQNEEIPMRYGYVGVKNRNQVDVMQELSIK